MNNDVQSIGILGAGKLGIVLAQLAVKAGYTVYIAGSGDAQKIRLSVAALVPGAFATDSNQAANNADIVILAFPLGRYKEVPSDALAGKIVIDAMNYWWEVDGERSDLNDLRTSSSELVQQHIPRSRVIKAFNHIGYHDLYDETRPNGAADRKAIAIAGDSAGDVSVVESIVDRLGFDAVNIGRLADGIKLQPGSALFGAHVTAEMVRHHAEAFDQTDHGMQVAQARLKN